MKIKIVVAVAGLLVMGLVFHNFTGADSGRRVDITVGQETLSVEIADTMYLRSKGLSNREFLPADEGMIFIFEYPQRTSFWMKDTSIPLSIGFISDDGVILQIEHMEPFDLSSVRSRYYVRYALEVNQGWFENNGVEVGADVDLGGLTNR